MPRSPLSPLRLGPVLGVLLAAALFGLAATRYPGGYAWLGQSVSSLFQPRLPDGALNPARLLATGAVLTFCASIAVVFHRLSASGPTRGHRKTIQIAGIGSMVYAALAVTPMHDVAIGVALAFFVVAMGALLHRVAVERRSGWLLAGLACVGLPLVNAATYFFGLGGGFHPGLQKIALVAWVGWLLFLHLREPETATA